MIFLVQPEVSEMCISVHSPKHLAMASAGLFASLTSFDHFYTVKLKTNSCIVFTDFQHKIISFSDH